MPLAWLSTAFQSLPLLPTNKLGPSGADSQVVGTCVYSRTSSELSCEARSFSCPCNPHRFLQPEGLRLYFPMLDPWVAQSVSLPSSSSQFISTQTWDHQVYQLPPSCVSSPFWLPVSVPPPVWMNVSSLTPWLLYIHASVFLAVLVLVWF